VPASARGRSACRKDHRRRIAPLDQLALPYRFYTDEDIAHRLIYVEASRGCPFRCEFCLSALDKTAWPFPLEPFLAELQTLHNRGVRHFKFVDRTFNLNSKTCARILDFFLERLDERLFLHFELIPDHLPEALKTRIVQFPPGALQFEIGVQTFNPTVQALISRKQDNRKTEENLRWLRQYTHASPTRRFDRWLAGRGSGQLRRRLQPAGSAGPARNSGRHSQAAARRAHRPPYRRFRLPLQPAAALTTCCARRCWTSQRCGGWSALPVLGFDRQFRAVPATLASCCWEMIPSGGSWR
jgi:hypothetical protein